MISHEIINSIAESVEPVEESALKRILRCFKLVSWVSLNVSKKDHKKSQWQILHYFD